ncbi:MAG: GDP-L-fucose synthase [Candidatus Pacebacteria bacterium]|nr:GDP-L-fucose synthase [Candidatus Paceibacterota bacterium]
MIDLKKKKILVTGAHGFLGKHLIKNLLEKRQVPKENLYTPTANELDLRNFENCKKAAKGQNIIIHLAAIVGGIGFNLEHPGIAFYDNAAMALNLLEAARQEGIEKFTGIGSVCEYPKEIPMPYQEEDLWSGYPEETNAPYGLAKKFMLVQSQAYRKEYNLNAIHLLMLNLYGPGDNFDPKSSHVIPALIKKIEDAKKEGKNYIEAWGTGKPTREFFYVEDAAEGIILATEKYDKVDPINLGSGKEISITELLELLCELMSFKGEIRWDATKPDGQPRRFFETSKAQKEFGFFAKTDLKEGLQKTIEDYKNRNKI